MRRGAVSGTMGFVCVGKSPVVKASLFVRIDAVLTDPGTAAPRGADFVGTGSGSNEPRPSGHADIRAGRSPRLAPVSV